MKLLQRENLGELIAKKASRGTSTVSDKSMSMFNIQSVLSELILYYSISITFNGSVS